MVSTPGRKLRAFFFVLLPSGAMKISAALGVWICAVFALVALGVVGTGLFNLGEVTDPAQREAAFGYIAFWGFLAAVAVVCGVMSWMIKQGKFGPVE